MTDTYKDFQCEPSRAHQCMHESENDGTRCRAMAMQNNYMCYAHRTDDVPTVIENDMFLIDNLDTHEAIQKTFCDVAARLACNHIDLKRAELSHSHKAESGKGPGQRQLQGVVISLSADQVFLDIG